MSLEEFLPENVRIIGMLYNVAAYGKAELNFVTNLKMAYSAVATMGFAVTMIYTI